MALVTCVVLSGVGEHGSDSRLPARLRKDLKAIDMLIALTIIVTIFLFGYLLAALLRPEWF